MAESRVSEQGTVRTVSFATRAKWTVVAGCIVSLLLPTAVFAELGDPASIGTPETLNGTLTYSGGDIYATGNWANSETQFIWTVARTGDSSAPLTYTYLFRTSYTHEDEVRLSHFDLLVSQGFDLNTDDFLNINGYSGMETVGNGQLPDWWTEVASDFDAIRFSNWDVVQIDGVYWNKIEFQSQRLPMVGLWWAKGASDIATNYYDEVFYGQTLVPDTARVPLPGAALLGMLGLSAAGLKLRRRA